MSKVNKLLLIIFAILLFIVIVEAGYYFSFTKSKSNSLLSTVKTSQLKINNVKPTRIVSEQNDLNFLKNYQNLVKDGSILSSVLTNKYYGNIITIELKNKIVKTKLGDIDVGADILLRYKNGKTENYYITKQQLTLTKVLIKEKQAQLNDLKPNNNVIIEISYDQTKAYKDRIMSIIITQE